MAAIIQVAGLASIYIGGTGGTLLGYTQNGAQVRFPAFFGDVPTDENGGDVGPPTDVQYFGETAEITLDFTKFDETVANTIRCRLASGTAGTIANVGGLMIAGTYSYRLTIASPTTPLNFPVTMFREPFEINKGTKFSTWRVIGTAYKNSSNVLYNTTTA
jgi:hypothetical protein